MSLLDDDLDLNPLFILKQWTVNAIKDANEDPFYGGNWNDVYPYDVDLDNLSIDIFDQMNLIKDAHLNNELYWILCYNVLTNKFVFVDYSLVNINRHYIAIRIVCDKSNDYITPMYLYKKFVK